jgi:hypothetical protein
MKKTTITNILRKTTIIIHILGLNCDEEIGMYEGPHLCSDYNKFIIIMYCLRFNSIKNTYR